MPKPYTKKGKTAGFRMTEATKKDDGFLRISDSMRNSKAWKKLSIHSRYLYMEFKAKYNGKNHDDLSFTYEEGRELMSVNTFSKSLDQLLLYGFIKYVRNQPQSRKCNIFALHDGWKDVR